MKKLLSIFSILLTFGVFQGCSYLEEDINEVILSENEITIEEMDAMLTGVYAGLFGQRNGGYRGRWLLFLEDLPTDINAGGNTNGLFDRFEYTDDNAVIYNIYKDIYWMIGRANVLIDFVNETGQQDIYVQHVAEARFLRALGYYDLSSLFGAVVLKTNAEEVEKDEPVVRSSFEEINQFIIDEMEELKNTLPTSHNERVGAATQGSAMALLVKTQLRAKNWIEVVNAATELDNLGKYRLIDNYEDLWDTNNALNEEVLFTVLPTDNIQGFSATDLSLHQYDNESDWFGSGNNFFLTKDFYYSFDTENDARWQNVMRHEWYNRDGELVKPLDENGNVQAGAVGPGESGIAKKYWCNKYPHGDAGKGLDLRTNPYQMVNLPVFRWADILLAWAEALNEITPVSTEAKAKLNFVRARAGLAGLNPINQEDLRRDILQERAWEFFQEGKRREDLIRMEKFIEFVAPSMDKDDVGNLNLSKYRYPIPSIELELNPEM